MKNTWLENWTADIDQLSEELPQKHKNLFFQLGKSDFDRQILALKRSLGQYDNCTIAIEIAKIISSAGDAHTALMIPTNRYIPFTFYWFEEGIYIVAASFLYTNLVHARVTHMNGKPIEDVILKVGTIVSHENPSFLKAMLPKYLCSAAVLYGLEIMDTFDKADLTVIYPDGSVREVTVDTVTTAVFQDILSGPAMPPDQDLPLYRQNRGQNYWSSFLEPQSTIYFNYHYCKDSGNVSVEDFCKGLLDELNQNKVRRLVIDLRNNLGGNSTLLEPFIGELTKIPKLNREGGLIVVLGRDTFSSALLNAYDLKKKTRAIFIGEASGGKPNCYGEVSYFVLQNSKLRIRYSTEYYDVIQDDSLLSLFPDVPFEVTFADYLANRDACMNYVLALTAPSFNA